MNLHTVTAKGTLPALLLFFLTFRLIYIPASVLTHTGHGLPWLTAALGLIVTFGGEWLTRNRSGLLPSESGASPVASKPVMSPKRTIFSMGSRGIEKFIGIVYEQMFDKSNPKEAPCARSSSE